ncbi:uncharacterized protein At4g04775-like [Lycium barbarum]|uniref:uncharacterized protein At4g04775-like n=1 Tax=Lycium barbarum TaxID=112863 RepID=UPI00293E8AE5|nr:uncharacterized protein At4g04775-like [Lycium barbarum]
MSQGSCSSHIKCNCGTIAKHLTSSTPSNPERKFYKCSRPKGNSCGFWEWEDELFPKIQWNNVQNLTSSLDAVKIERDKLQEELIAIEARHLIEVNKMKEELIDLKSKQQFDLKKSSKLGGETCKYKDVAFDFVGNIYWLFGGFLNQLNLCCCML